MLAYIGRRIVLGILTIWAISFLAFFISQLPPATRSSVTWTRS